MRYMLFLLCLLCTGRCWADASSDDATIRALYAKYQKAYNSHDVKPVMAMVTANFTAGMKDGKKLSRAEYEALMKEQVKLAQQETLKIDSVTVEGNHATAVTEETLNAPPMASHIMGSVAKCRDTWVRTAAGWRISHEESLEETYTMDGQPFDPSQFKTP